MPNSVSSTTFPVCDTSFIGAILRRVKMADVIVFLIPATQFFELKIVGRLFLPDTLLALILPVLFVDYGQRLRARLPTIFISLALLWLFGQVITDIVRGTVFSDYARGWAKIGFTLINFCALYLLLYGHQRRLTLYAVGLATGGLISYLRQSKSICGRLSMEIWVWHADNLVSDIARSADYQPSPHGTLYCERDTDRHRRSEHIHGFPESRWNLLPHCDICIHAVPMGGTACECTYTGTPIVVGWICIGGCRDRSYQVVRLRRRLRIIG